MAQNTINIDKRNSINLGKNTAATASNRQPSYRGKLMVDVSVVKAYMEANPGADKIELSIPLWERKTGSLSGDVGLWGKQFQDFNKQLATQSKTQLTADLAAAKGVNTNTGEITPPEVADDLPI